MSTTTRPDITDPELYSPNKPYRYLVQYGFSGPKYPKPGLFSEHTGGTATVSRAEKIRSLADIKDIQKDLVAKLKKTIFFWNNAELVVLGFSRFED